jgi:hypothetical protein
MHASAEVGAGTCMRAARQKCQRGRQWLRGPNVELEAYLDAVVHTRCGTGASTWSSGSTVAGREHHMVRLMEERRCVADGERQVPWRGRPQCCAGLGRPCRGACVLGIPVAQHHSSQLQHRSVCGMLQLVGPSIVLRGDSRGARVGAPLSQSGAESRR